MNDWHDALSALSSQFAQEEPVAEAQKLPEESTPAPEVQSEPLHIALERKGRAGKTATIIFGFTVSDERVAEVAAQLKRSLGCGGSARGGEILLQGDRQTRLHPLLARLGFKLK